MAVIAEPASVVAKLQALLLLTLGLLSCEHVTFTDVGELTPPEAYQAWWGETAACVGQQEAPFDRVHWFTVTQINEGEAEHGGYWRRPHEIYLRVDQVLIRSVVRHEMVHDLLQRGSHDSPYFEACAASDG